MSRTEATLHRLAAAVMADPGAWPERRADLDALCDVAGVHGVLPLLASQATSPPLPADWCEAVRRRAASSVAADLVRERDLQCLVGRLHDAGIHALLIKGAHLAYTVYPRPDLRPRVDTDLLIDAGEVARANAELQALGYDPIPQLTADLVMYQRPYERRRAGGVTHTVDLHWRLSNPQRFGQVLAHGELWQRAQPIPALSPKAQGPCAVDGLLIACVHRIAHHYDAARLIWTYDIHLLATTFGDEDWRRFTALACERQIARACQRGLESAAAHFQTTVPAAVMRRLRDAAATERSMRAYLGDAPRHISRIVEDLRGVGSLAQAVRLARQHVLPPAAYMREIYAPSSSAPLPWLYARRAWGGARRWLGRS